MKSQIMLKIEVGDLQIYILNNIKHGFLNNASFKSGEGSP